MSVDRVAIWLLAAVWIGLVIVPLVGVVIYSVFHVEQFRLTPQFDLSAFTDMARSGRWGVIVRTLWIATVVTAINLAIALPFAFWLSKIVTSPAIKTLILTASVVPYFLSASARTIVWRPLLSTNGLLNTVLIQAGIIDQPISVLLFSQPAVIGGLAITYFPSMLFPVFLAISLINNDYLAASSDLGARPLTRMWTIVLPLALPGIVAGVIFTFVPVLGEAIIPQLLGGGGVNMVSRSVISAIQALNLNVAAAMCTIIFVFLGLLLLLLYASWRRSGFGSGAVGLRP